MAATLESLALQALDLPPDQRVALAHQLLVSVEPAPDPNAEAAWELEIARRIRLSDAGEIEALPAEEVFEYWRRIAPDPK